MKWSKSGLLVLPVLLAALAVILGAQWWEHRKERPLEAALGDFKADQYDRSLPTIRRFARDGHRVAQIVLATAYARGLGVAADPVQASIWFRRAECACTTTGRSEMAEAKFHLDGSAAAGRQSQVLLWLGRAADAGHEEAQRLLAERETLIAKGIAVPDEVSAYWRRVLSDQ